MEGSNSRPCFKLGEDVNTIMKKRWSGIALNSKLYQAYDRLSKEEEEYTDSLENPERQDGSGNSNSDKNIPPLQEDREPESLDSNFSDEKPLNGEYFLVNISSKILTMTINFFSQLWLLQSSFLYLLLGKRFKKLQQKWEMLSGQNSTESPPPSPTHVTTKSKIPRPITSPVKPSGIPVLVKKVTTPPGGKNPLVKGPGSVKSSPARKAGPSAR